MIKPKSADTDPKDKSAAEDPEVDQEGVAISRSDQLRRLISENLEKVGLFVFAITAIATILFVLGFNFFAPPTDIYSSPPGTSPYSYLRI